MINFFEVAIGSPGGAYIIFEWAMLAHVHSYTSLNTDTMQSPLNPTVSPVYSNPHLTLTFVLPLLNRMVETNTNKFLPLHET